MNIYWQPTDTTYELHRFPKGNHDKSLQAWDSADELLVQHITAQKEDVTSLVILNDSFGALNVALHGHKISSINDSYVSQQALEQNLRINHLSDVYHDSSQQLDSLQAIPPASHVVLKLTKNLGYLEFQLQQIKRVNQACHIVAAGKTTQVTSSVLALFNKYFNQVTTSLAKKKSRLIFASHAPEKLDIESKYPVQTQWPEQNLTLFAHANVFSKDQIDIGGRFLAENLPQISNNQRIIDLGCGNGLLGLASLMQAQNNNANAEVSFVDESHMAVMSAKLNVEKQFPERLPYCQFIQDDCLTQQENLSADIILCNPPFHQQNAITEHIAQQMFKDAKRVLKPGGKLYVVANRHLPYQVQLKKHFGGFKVNNQNKKFIIYLCQKKDK
ncbi:MAG: methyltransferase [Gammaproteobacteria bacterium]|nr:methyltransferase [Gammaproteobacteria bacterium]